MKSITDLLQLLQFIFAHDVISATDNHTSQETTKRLSLLADPVEGRMVTHRNAIALANAENRSINVCDSC